MRLSGTLSMTCMLNAVLTHASADTALKTAVLPLILTQYPFSPSQVPSSELVDAPPVVVAETTFDIAPSFFNWSHAANLK